MTNVVDFPTDPLIILLCPVCGNEEWWLTNKGEVVCSKCHSDVLYRWWDSEETGGAA